MRFRRNVRLSFDRPVGAGLALSNLQGFNTQEQRGSMNGYRTCAVLGLLDALCCGCTSTAWKTRGGPGYCKVFVPAQ